MRYTKKIRVEIYKLLATTNCDVAKLCRLVGIDRSTYYKWYNNYEEFQNIVKSSRAEFRSIKRENVISSLYRRAMGYMVTEVRETIKENERGERIEKKIVYYKKYIPPSEKAIKYFLENFDEEGYEVFIDYDVEEEDDDDNDDPLQGTQGVDNNDPLCLRHTDVQGTCFQHTDVQGVDNDDDNENLESLRQEQGNIIKSQIESEQVEGNIINKYEIESEEFEIVEEDTISKINIKPIINVEPLINIESKSSVAVVEVQTKTETVAVAEIIVSPEVIKHAKLREAVALVISELSPEIQKEVKEKTDAMPTVRADFLVGLPCSYALRIASRTYEEKKIEYRKKHNIPFNDYKLKPYPVSFNSDEGERRMNVSFRERMHDVPIIEEMNALKKYIVAARMERYYEDLLITHKSYYADIWD